MDGSKTENGAGSGVVIYRQQQRIYKQSKRLSDSTTVFQAEVYAIHEAAKQLIKETTINFSYVKIISDSQAALRALAAEQVKSRIVMDTIRTNIGLPEGPHKISQASLDKSTHRTRR